MKKTKTLVAMLLYCNTCFLQAQNITILNNKCLGGTGVEGAGKMINAGGYNFIISGVSGSPISGNKTVANCDSTLDGWILKLDTALNIIWQKTIGGDGGEGKFTLSRSAYNNHVLFALESNSDSSCNHTDSSRGTEDYWVGAMDTSGNIVWQRNVGGSGSDFNPSIIQLKNGNYFVGGRSISPISGDKTMPNFSSLIFDFWIVGIDSIGNKLWDKVFGGTEQENIYAPSINSSCLKYAGPNAFYLFGYSRSSQSGNITAINYGLDDYVVFKIDTLGNVIYNKLYGGTYNDRITDFTVTNDGGFLITGYTNSPPSGLITDSMRTLYDYWIVKCDSGGNLLWQKRYGSATGSNGITPSCAIQYVNGGYLIGGIAQSQPPGNEVSEFGYGGVDYWVLCIDSMGNKLWDKKFGGNRNDLLSDMLLLPDTSVILFGHADTGASIIKTDYGYGDKDYWVVRFKEDFTTGIYEASATVTANLYPNPAQNELKVLASAILQQITLRTIQGKALQTLQPLLPTATVNIQHLAAGVYIAEVNTTKGRVFKRFVKQ